MIMNNKCKHDAKVLERETKATNRYNELDGIFRSSNDRANWYEVINPRYKHPTVKV